MTPYTFTIYEWRDNAWRFYRSGCGNGGYDWYAAHRIMPTSRLKLEVRYLGQHDHTAYAGPA